MRNNLLPLFIALLSGLIALAVGVFAETQYQTLVATTELVTPAIQIPPYTVVAPQMFKLRSFPSPMAGEPVYRSLEEMAGKISTVTLNPDHLVYRDQVVPLSQFRYTDDERLEVISFPIQPEQAVGGQIKPGQRINLYRIVLQTTVPQNVANSADPKVWLALPGAGVELLEADVPVVDVRSSQGSPVVSPPAVPASSGEAMTYTPASANAANAPRPLTILTVAVSPEAAKGILRLAGEARMGARYLLWVSLAPSASKAAK